VKEAILSQQFGFPVFVISGSGRQADDKLSTANFQAPNIYHVHKSEPEELRDLLKNLGLSR